VDTFLAVSKGFFTGWLTEKERVNCLVSKHLVPKRGLEPPLPDGNYTLNVARLPIPPLRRFYCLLYYPHQARSISSIVPVAIFHLAIQLRPCQAQVIELSSPD
jgi:hypothetical protein